MTDRHLKARLLVVDYYNFRLDVGKKLESNLANRRGQGPELANVPDTIDVDDVYVVWSCYILGNWKCMLSTTVPDDRYYEVTYKAEHDGSDGAQTIYFDSWKKEANVEYDAQHPIHNM